VYFYLAGLLLLLGDLALPAGRKFPGALLVALCLLLPGRAEARPGDAPDKAEAARQASAGLEAFAAGRDAEALQAFLRARVQSPDSPELLFDLGAASYRLGRFGRARELFARAAAEAGSPALRAKALYNQGNAASREGDAEAALALYEAALAVDPNDADSRANRDWLRERPRAEKPREEGDKAGDKPGQTPNPDAGGQGGKEGQGRAPAPQGRDDGSGREREAEDRPTPAAGDPDRPGSGQAAVPLASPQGREKAGEKRAAAPGGADDPILSRVPDLSGLPQAPGYGRPSVEKDW
jgi:Ca-activated chloride channel family protein